MRHALSVVMPVHNEAGDLPATIGALLTAIDRSGFDAELIVVDDGSTDRSAAIASEAAERRVPLRIISQPNAGRFTARRVGTEAAHAELVLLLDGRVRVAPDALAFAHARVEAGETVWTAHVHVQSAGNLYGLFWQLLAELAWFDYFRRPRTVSFGVEDFDRYPKGTTCFLAPRTLLESAFAGFRSQYGDVRLANDDTPILRSIAAHERIHISPEFACTYSPRTTVMSFFRHAVRRGIVFVDGHGKPESRFFPYVVAFFPLSAALAVGAVKRPLLLPVALAGCGAAAAAYGARVGRPPRDLQTLAVVTPLYALGHGLGMWRGALELLR